MHVRCMRCFSMMPSENQQLKHMRVRVLHINPTTQPQSPTHGNICGLPLQAPQSVATRACHTENKPQGAENPIHLENEDGERNGRLQLRL